MRLYPDAAKLYANESGFITTEASTDSYLKVMRHCQSHFPDHEVSDFTTQELATYCLLPPVGKPAPAPKTIRTRMGHMRGSFRWWRWRGLVGPDPAVDLPLVVKPGTFGIRQHTWLTPQQVKDLYHSYDPGDQVEVRDRLIIMIGIFTGLRLDALGRMRWAQVSADFTSLRVTVKGNKQLELPIVEQLADELREWKRLAPKRAQAVIPSVKEAFDPGWLRRSKTLNWDKPLGAAGVYQIVKKAGDRIGVDLAPHDMRRTFAGWLEDEGIDLRAIQGLMGHEDISTTAGYLEKNPARLQRAVVGLRRAL